MPTGQSPENPTEPPSLTRALVDRVQQGDRQRFGELFDRLAPALYSWVNLRIAPKLRADVEPEDVVQEVWCRALVRFADFDASRARFRSWVFGIGKNVLLEAFRSLRSRPRAAVGPEDSARVRPEYIPDEATAVSQRVARSLEVKAFLERIAELDPDDRELVILRGLQELPHEQVGVHLGIGEDAAQKRWVRLRDRLRGEGIAEDILVA